MPHPKFWIGTSWKMNKTLAEAKTFVQSLAANSRDLDSSIQRFVIPPFTAAREVATALKDSSIRVGAQNMHWKDSGSWTGEISAPMLVDCDLSLVELGHSERRTHFGETDETVGLKVEAAVRHGLTPLICLGETETDFQSGNAKQVLERQTRAALSKLKPNQLEAEVLLAYEPVWAIGEAGRPASSEYADARQSEITDVAEQVLGRKIPCLYGGSVNQRNCKELFQAPHIDGLFIGRAAWDVEGYLAILEICSDAISSTKEKL